MNRSAAGSDGAPLMMTLKSSPSSDCPIMTSYQTNGRVVVRLENSMIFATVKP